MLCDKRHFDRTGKLLSCFLLVFVLLAMSSCGKKGAPSLASYEKPSPPSQLTIRHRENKIILFWSFPAEKERLISNFIILRSSGTGFQKFASVESHMRMFTDSDYNEGAEYRYEVVAQNFTGISSDPSNVAAVTPASPPLPPGEISYEIKEDAVILSWEMTAKDALFNIYRSFESGPYGLDPANPSPLAENSFKDVFYIDRPVHYIVRSLTRNLDEGPASRELIVDPLTLRPGQPEDVNYFAAPDRIYLYWKVPSAAWITGYRVYRRLGSADYALVGQTQIASFVDPGDSLQSRDYRITAVGPLQEGPATEIRGVRYKPE